MFSVVKNGPSGILESLDAVTKLVDQFRKNNLEGTSIEVTLLDDESIDIRNRLKIISTNGSIGFILTLYYSSNSVNTILNCFNSSYNLQLRRNPVKQRLIALGRRRGRRAPARAASLPRPAIDFRASRSR